MDEHKANLIRERGLRAEELLNNSLLQEVFSYLETEYLSAWRKTRVMDTQAREKLWQAVQIVGLVQDHLGKFVRDGKIATRDLAAVKYLKR